MDKSKMLPKTGKCGPEIRFKGFTDDWEQRKWVDTVDISTEMVDPKSGEYDELPHVAPGNIESFTGGLYDNVKLVKDEQLISGKFHFYSGDIIYGKINPQLGKYVYAQFEGLTSADAYVLNGKNGLNQKFLFAMLQSDDFYKYSVSVSMRSGMPKINRNELNAYIFFTPSASEQMKIGNLFLELDSLITLHQRKCDRLQNIKKSMLTKMFPKDGERVPEIRFKGFNGDWEQRKFSELYMKSSEKNDGSIGMDKNITVATMQFKSDVRVSTEEYLKTYYTFRKGDIAFEGHQSKEFRFGRFVENDIGDGIISHIFVVFRPIVDYDLHFWKYAINNEGLMQRVLSRSTKASTMMHDLVSEDFLKETFLVPDIEEQKEIGAYFKHLDNLIAFHQRKCEKLIDMKKAFLKKMFGGTN